jgi:hypothetical protein
MDDNVQYPIHCSLYRIIRRWYTYCHVYAARMINAIHLIWQRFYLLPYVLRAWPTPMQGYYLFMFVQRWVLYV